MRLRAKIAAVLLQYHEAALSFLCQVQVQVQDTRHRIGWTSTTDRLDWTDDVPLPLSAYAPAYQRTTPWITPAPHPHDLDHNGYGLAHPSPSSLNVYAPVDSIGRVGGRPA